MQCTYIPIQWHAVKFLRNVRQGSRSHVTAVDVQISYLILLALYSYFMIVELHPRQPTVIEYIVWGWSATLWLEEFRQVWLFHHKVLWWACLSIYLSDRISWKPHVRASWTLCACWYGPGPVPSVGFVICHVLPVLWMTSCFHIMSPMVPHVVCLSSNSITAKSTTSILTKFDSTKPAS